MKTPLQELKLIIQDMINHGGDDDLFPVLTHIENLLPKEKEVIEILQNLSKQGIIYEIKPDTWKKL